MIKGMISVRSAVIHEKLIYWSYWVFLSLLSAQGQEPQHTVQTCEGSSVRYDCPPGYYVAIVNATYGWAETSGCPSQPEPPSGCVLESAGAVVGRVCNKRNFCTIRVGFELLGDPCNGTSKVLNTVYRCRLPLFTSLTCQETKAVLECPTGYVIDIQDAFWGRQDSKTCRDANMADTSCSQSDAKERIQELCQYQNTCELYTYNTTLGEPCRGTYKYLTTSFHCVSCVNENTNDAKCVTYRSRGECERNPEWMIPYCRRACLRCDGADDCQDTYTGSGRACRYWAARGQCRLNPDFMTDKCRRSCNQCLLCQDFAPDCPTRIARGECQSNYVFMRTNCRQSCQICTPDSPRVSPSGAPVLPPGASPAVPSTAVTTGAPPVAQEVLACEGKLAVLSCAAGRQLVVRHLMFGRQSPLVCPHPTALVNVTCGLDAEGYSRAMHKMETYCSGRRSCHVAANWRVWGDTCPGAYKYLVVKYTCEPLSACRSADGDILCQERADNHQCERNRQDMVASCRSTCLTCDQTECGNVNSNEANCDYWAMIGECKQNPDWMTTNCQESCRKCPKRVQQATPAPVETRIALICEGLSSRLACHRARLHLISAYYGREDFSTCPHASALKQKDCSQPNVLSTLATRCAAKPYCDVSVNTNVYGDPCPGTYKYMRITYQCIAAPEIVCDSPCKNGGSCVAKDTCVCADGFQGDQCQDFLCGGDPVCSGRGQCVGPFNCSCEAGWTGSTCAKPSCEQVDNCGNRGHCVGPNRCRCFPYFSGERCQSCNPSGLTVGPSCLPCVKCDHGTCSFPDSQWEIPSYLGCYRDEQERDLPHLVWRKQDNSPELCMRACHQRGFAYAAVQYGDNCYCGNSFGSYGETGNCNMACRGNPEATCGGLFANSVYRTDEGECRCSGVNWTGRQCSQCAEGYSGPTCTRVSHKVSLATAPTFFVPSQSTFSMTDGSTRGLTPVAPPLVSSKTSPGTVHTTTIGTTSTPRTEATTSEVTSSATPVQYPTALPGNKPFTGNTFKPSSPTSTMPTSKTSGEPNTDGPSRTQSSVPRSPGPRSPAPSILPPVTSPPPASPTGPTTLATSSPTRPVTSVVNISVADKWTDDFRDLKKQTTKEYLAKLTSAFDELYKKNQVPGYMKVIVIQLYPGSVIAEQEVTVNVSHDVMEDEVRCSIWRLVGPNQTLANQLAIRRLAGPRYAGCLASAAQCQHGGTPELLVDNSLSCGCPPNYEGRHCEQQRWDPALAVVVIVISISVPLLFLVLICILLVGRGRARPSLGYHTARSFRFQGMATKMNIQSGKAGNMRSVSKGTINSLRSLPSADNSYQNVAPNDKLFNPRKA